MQKLTEKQVKIIKQKINLNEGLIIIRLEITCEKNIPKEDTNRNIYGVTNDYRILWQIKHDQACPHPDVPFVNIKLDGSELITRDFAGFIYKLNPLNGETKIISWDK